MCKYEFYLWEGSGYVLDGPFVVNDTDFESALDELVAGLIKDGLSEYYLTEAEYDELCDRVGYDRENEVDDLEGYIYIDATMCGAPYPVYLNTENMKVIW